MQGLQRLAFCWKSTDACHVHSITTAQNSEILFIQPFKKKVSFQIIANPQIDTKENSKNNITLGWK